MTGSPFCASSTISGRKSTVAWVALRPLPLLSTQVANTPLTRPTSAAPACMPLPSMSAASSHSALLANSVGVHSCDRVNVSSPSPPLRVLPPPAVSLSLPASPLSVLLSPASRVSLPLPPQSVALAERPEAVPPFRLSLPSPPYSVSAPPLPIRMSSPPLPLSTLAAELPVMVLAPAPPVALTAAVPVSVMFSTYMPDVSTLPVDCTVSVPSFAFSMMVSPAPMT